MTLQLHRLEESLLQSTGTYNTLVVPWLIVLATRRNRDGISVRLPTKLDGLHVDGVLAVVADGGRVRASRGEADNSSSSEDELHFDVEDIKDRTGRGKSRR